MYDIIIIGAGMAGMTAALYCLRTDKSVLLIEAETVGGQIANSPRVENYPTVEAIGGSELANRLFEQVLGLGAEFELERVQKVEKVAEKDEAVRPLPFKCFQHLTAVSRRSVDIRSDKPFHCCPSKKPIPPAEALRSGAA